MNLRYLLDEAPAHSCGACRGGVMSAQEGVYRTMFDPATFRKRESCELTYECASCGARIAVMQRLSFAVSNDHPLGRYYLTPAAEPGEIKAHPDTADN